MTDTNIATISDTTPIREQIVATARTALGVPFRHQGRSLTRGVDCIGLVICVLNKLGLSDFDYTSYPMQPPADLMTQTMRELLTVIPRDQAQPGDLYRFKVAGEPIHVGIATDVGVIHAVQSTGGVVEHVLSPAWSNRIVETYRLPGVK